MPGIIRLTVHNLLRIRAAEVTPDGSLVIVAGENDQGKSSLLNAIAIALSGKELPIMPIRQGAASGHVILETEDMIVTRKFSQSGGATLEVRDRDGAKVTSPQAKLDALVSRITFDPFGFTQMEPKQQLETVRQIAGLDFTELDSEYATKYEERTGVNRQVRAQEGVLTGIRRDPSAPKEPVIVADLMRQLEEIQTFNAANAKRREALGDLNDGVDQAEENLQFMERAAEQARAALAKAEQSVSDARDGVRQATEQRDAMKTAVAALTDQDAAPVAEQIKGAEAINQAIRENARWGTEHKNLVALQSKSGELTARLEEIQAEKQRRLEQAKLPVDGLTFDDSGLLYNSVPFDQAGTAVKIRTSIAIARSLNPGLPVMLIKDGSLLGANSLAIVKEEAETHGLQIWLEVVGDRDDATVVIEDGAVIDTAETKKAKAKKK